MFLFCTQTHLVSLQRGAGLVSRGLNMTLHFQIVPRLRMSWLYLHFTIHPVFVLCPSWVPEKVDVNKKA
jgi:hypothetical protein